MGGSAGPCGIRSYARFWGSDDQVSPHEGGRMKAPAAAGKLRHKGMKARRRRGTSAEVSHSVSWCHLLFSRTSNAPNRCGIHFSEQRPARAPGRGHEDERRGDSSPERRSPYTSGVCCVFPALKTQHGRAALDGSDGLAGGYGNFERISIIPCGIVEARYCINYELRIKNYELGLVGLGWRRGGAAIVHRDRGIAEDEVKQSFRDAC